MARGRRKSSKQKSDNPAANADFESLSFPGGSAVRAGRNIYLRSDIDASEHARRLQSVTDSIPGVEAKRNGGRDRLEAVLRETGPLECVALASATYLIKNAETYRESEDDRSPAHIEFLALAALPLLETYGAVESTARGEGSYPGEPALSATEEDLTERISGDTESPIDGRAETESVEAGAEGDSDDGQDDVAFDRASAMWAASSEAVGLVREAFADTTDLIWMRSIAKESEPSTPATLRDHVRAAWRW